MQGIHEGQYKCHHRKIFLNIFLFFPVQTVLASLIGLFQRSVKLTRKRFYWIAPRYLLIHFLSALPPNYPAERPLFVIKLKNIFWENNFFCQPQILMSMSGLKCSKIGYFDPQSVYLLIGAISKCDAF